MSRTTQHSRTRRIVKALLLTYIVCQILFTAAFAFYPPVGAVAMILLGRGPDCPRRQAIHAFYRHWSNFEKQREVSQDSHVAREDGEGYQLVETPWGEFWEPVVGGSAVLAQIAEMRAKYDSYPVRPLRPGDVALDCGANVGVATRQMLDFGARLVVAIEPSPKNVESLRRNFASEINEGKVIVYAKGVWDKDDILELFENADTTAMDSFVNHDAARPGVKVPLTTIDKAVAELSLDRVDFIKMDIEGAEQRALRGAAGTLKRFRPRMEISVNHLPDDPRRIPEIIRDIQPAYRYDCLLCEGDWSKWRVKSEILLFE